MFYENRFRSGFWYAKENDLESEFPDLIFYMKKKYFFKGNFKSDF